MKYDSLKDSSATLRETGVARGQIVRPTSGACDPGASFGSVMKRWVSLEAINGESFCEPICRALREPGQIKRGWQGIVATPREITSAGRTGSELASMALRRFGQSCTRHIFHQEVAR